MAAPVSVLPEVGRRTTTDDVEEILKRWTKLRDNRSTWEAHWQEIAERIWPAADEYFQQTRRTPGEKRTEKIYDSTGALALEKFSASLESLLTPRQQKWHRLRSTDERLNDDPAVKAWFDEVTRLMFLSRNAPKAGFYSQMHEGYKSLGAFGTAGFFVEETDEQFIRYQHVHLGQLFLEVNQYGDVDTFYRLIPLSAKAAVQRWGDRTPDKVKQALEKDPWSKHDFLHVVTPRRDADPDALDFRRLPFQSLHIAVEDKVLLDEGGFSSSPFAVGRWTVNPNEMYGRSPAMLVLPSIKTANSMQKTFLRSGHKVADPPVLAAHEGVLGRGAKQIRLEPGKINYTQFENGKPLVQPFQSGARLDLTETMLERERDVINDAMMARFYQFLREHPELTATQALLVAEQEGVLVAPAIGRQQSELLGPLIHREFEILAQRPDFPEIPPVMLEASGEYEIEYVSPGTQFQRSGELIATQRTLELAAPFIASDPTWIQKFNAERIIELGQEVHGAPAEILRTSDEFAQIRAQAAQQQAAEQTLMAIREGAAAAKDAAQAQNLAPETEVPGA